MDTIRSIDGKAFAAGVLEQMKQEVPWSQTWIDEEGFRGYTNAATGEPYGIIETLMLASQGMRDEVVATEEEWRSVGYTVEHDDPLMRSEAVILKAGQTLEELYDEEGNIREGVGVVVYGSRNVYKTTTGFGYPLRTRAKYPSVDIPATRLDEVLAAYYAEEGIDYAEEEGSQSYYSPEDDEIRLPAKKQFTSAAGYLATKAHESIHSTGAYVRCNREAFKKFGAKFGTMKYSREELVAEIGSGLLLAAFGLDTEDTRRNVAAYCQNWLQQLQNNPRWVLTAAELAQEAVDYIMQYA